MSRQWFKAQQLVYVIVVAWLPIMDAPGAQSESPQRCEIGTYVLSDGSNVDIAESDGDTLRWLKFTGERGQLHPRAQGTWSSTYGWTDRPDGITVSFSECEKGAITFQGMPGKRLNFDVNDTVFERDGVRLAGRLVMPRGNDKVPVVVLVHGSEHDSALATYPLQRIFPAQRIGVFVYDKRGTGISGGEYTQNFNVLADDAVAAMNEAKRLAGGRRARVGYQGGSEGGWVVPLAVNRMPVDFAIVSFGLAVTVLEEDQQSVALDMHFHHHSTADTRKALELARAGEYVVETGGREGYDRFDALRRKYSAEPWYKDVHGDFLFFILPLEQRQIIEAIEEFKFNTTPFRHEPMPVLRASRTPQLWIVGTDDLESPSAETTRRIESLIARGHSPWQYTPGLSTA
jgi:pimeloyl-ACP methyl ester carboxylesterase